MGTKSRMPLLFKLGDVWKVCGIHIVWKTLDKSRRRTGSGPPLTGKAAPPPEGSGELESGGGPEALPGHAKEGRLPGEDCPVGSENQAAKWVWRAVGAGLGEGSGARGELAGLLVEESGERRKHASRLACVRKALQLESECRRVQEKMLGGHFSGQCRPDAWSGEDGLLDRVILECPSVWHFEKALLGRSDEPTIFGDLASCIFDRVTQWLDFDGGPGLEDFVRKVSKVGMASEIMYRLARSEGRFSERLGNFSFVLDGIHSSKKNESERNQKMTLLLLELFLINGYFLSSKLGNEYFDERKVCTLLARLGELFVEEERRSGGSGGSGSSRTFGEVCHLVEMVLLQLTKEAKPCSRFRLDALRLFGGVLVAVGGRGLNGLMARLIVSNIVENFGLEKAPGTEEEDAVHREFARVLDVLFFSRRGGEETWLQNELERQSSRLDVEVLERLLSKGLVRPGKVREAIELMLDQVQDQLVGGLGRQGEEGRRNSPLELSKINMDLLKGVIESQKDGEGLDAGFLENCLVSSLARALRVLGEEREETAASAGRQLGGGGSRMESGRTDLLGLLSKVNLAFDQLSERGLRGLVAVVNSYGLPGLVQTALKEEASKDSCRWGLVSEGVRFLNNYLLAGADFFGPVEKADEMFEFSKSVMTDIETHFIDYEANRVEPKPSIPPVDVYFEMLRLVHNASCVLSRLKEGTESSSGNPVQFLSQGIIPFNLNVQGRNPDFLIDRVNSFFRDNPVQGEVNPSPDPDPARDNKKSTNIIFIHGLLGSALRSWSIDISKESKIPVVTDSHHLQNIHFPERKGGDGSDVVSRLRGGGSSEAISRLERSNYLIWPRILLGEREDVRMFAVDYSSRGVFSRDRSATLEEISEEIYGKLLRADIFPGGGGRSNIVVCHSMGGILLKLMLSNHPETLGSIRGVVFFGTPHFGTNLHSRLARLLRRKVSPYVVELSSALNLEDLRELNSKFQRLVYSLPKHERPLICSFSESLPCKIPFLFNAARVMVVPLPSSNPFIGSSYTLETDHNFINKLTAYRDDVRYLLIEHMIEACR